MSYMPPDERQLFIHSARQHAEMASIMWKALLDQNLPEEVATRLLHAWWIEVLRPPLPQMPDFGAIFGRHEGADE